MPSPLVNATLQAACLSALSNTIAQGIKAYQRKTSWMLNWVPLAQFVLFTILTCPPNFLWQEFLEETFPGYILQPDGTHALSKTNTATKFGLDQTLGSLVNSALFIAYFAGINRKNGPAVQRAVRRETIPLVMTGWRVWPVVSLLNFTLVPVHRRILVGSLVGLFWGVYLSLFAAS